MQIREIFYNGSFTPAEVQVVALTNAFENACSYCMALHSSFARKERVSAETIEALRAGRSPVEPRLKALSDFSRKLVRERGNISADDLKAFTEAGFTQAQALEVVLGVAVSILPNFAHHITECPLDEMFKSQLWSQPGQ